MAADAQMRSRRGPSMFTILFAVVAIAVAATWLVPGGRFATVSFDSDNGLLVVADGAQEHTLPATQRSLASLHVQTPIQTLTSGTANRPIPIPGSYRPVAADPQGPLALFTAPIRGTIAAADIFIFVLVIGGFIALINRSGAFDAAIAALASRLEGREHWLVIVFTMLFAVGGTTDGMAEETIAFYPLLAPVFLRAGYDRIVPLAVILGGSQMGCLGATVNPFSIIIASATIGVRWTDQIALRAIVWLLVVGATISWTLWYARGVRRNPSRSLAPAETAVPATLESEAEPPKMRQPPLTGRSKLLLALFGLTFVIMIVGVSKLDWWFPEMSALFLGSAILAAMLQGGTGKAEAFLRGAGDLLGVASLIGLARAVSVTLEASHVDATIVHSMSEALAGTAHAAFLVGTYIFFVLIEFVNGSSSGVAVLTMPLLGPAASAVGVTGASVVSAYVFGHNLLGTVVPNGLAIPSLAMMGVRYGPWLRFMAPLLVFVAIVSVASLLTVS